MEICYDQGCNDIGVVIATKLRAVKDFKAVLLSLAPTLVNTRVTEMFEISFCLLVLFSSCCTSSSLGQRPYRGSKKRGG